MPGRRFQLQLVVISVFALCIASAGCGKTKSPQPTAAKTDDPKTPEKTNPNGKVAGTKTSKTDNTNTVKKTDNTAKTKVPVKTKVAKKGKKSNLSPEKAARARIKELGGEFTLNISGEVSSIDFQGNDKVKNEDLAMLVHFPYLNKLDVSYTKHISDDGMKPVAQVPRLRELIIAGTTVGDDGVKHLANMDGLVHVCLDRTKVTDKVIQYVKKWPDLRQLHLIRTNFTDAGLKQLLMIPNLRLKELYLGGTKVSKDGKKAVQIRWPGIREVPRG